MNATFTRRNGRWVIRVTGGIPTSGDRITVTKRSGSSSTVTVESIVSSNGTETLCTIAQNAPRRSYATSSFRGRCEDAPCCGCGGACGTPLGYSSDYGNEY